MNRERRRLAGAVAVVLAAAGVLFFMFRQFEHSQVYHPDRTFAASPAELRRPFEDVWFAAADGVKLNGWFFPANTNSPRSSLAVLVCHGNGGNISYRLAMADALLATGVSVFLFDYRGYGRSEGRPSEAGTYQDAQAAHHWLQAKGFAPRQIVAYGESLGGGVAAELAAGDPVAGLVLQSTFTSLPDVGAALYPWLPVRWLSSIRYDTLSKLPRLHVPVMVMHSRGDGLIAFRHSERNFAAANEPKLFWELTGQHNEPVGDRAHYIAGMEKFLTLVTSQPATQAR